MNLNREQIVKALECCISGDDCTICPLCDEQSCPCVLNENALSLIKELTEENERLRAENTDCRLGFGLIEDAFERLEKINEQIKSETSADTVRKMQEQIKAEIDYFDRRGGSAFINKAIVFFFIDQIAKEMIGEEND